MGEILPEVANSGENGERTKTWTTMFGVDVSVVVDAFDVVFLNGCTPPLVVRLTPPMSTTLFCDVFFLRWLNYLTKFSQHI